MGEAANWAIVDDYGVVDRFTTKREADEALAFGGYPDDLAVVYAPDPNHAGEEDES